jgi:LPS-assembly protein
LLLLSAQPALALPEPGICPQPLLAQEFPTVSLAAPADGKLVLTADQATLEQDGLSSLLGDVRLTQGDAEFSAKALDYNPENRKVSINAESLFRNRGYVIKSQRADFDLNSETGSFFDTEFLLTGEAAHGSASHITLARAGTADLESVRYTTCAPGHEVWQLRASDIRLDQSSGRGSARNAWLRFAGVPLFWLPYFQFPIDNQRHTGLLFPLIGNSSNAGFDTRWPLYLNLGPNYDAQLIPRYMTKRGLQLGSDFRYLLRRGRGNLHYEDLDKDQVTGSHRNYLAVDHVSLLSRRLGLDLRYAEVSDPGYFEDLGGKLDTSAISYLERYARVTYQAPASYTVQTLFQDFQTITRSVGADDKPYKRLPQVRFNALTRNSWHDLRLGIDSEFVNFAREDAIQGQRVDLQPYLRFFTDNNAWYINSQFDWQFTRYQLTNRPVGQAEAPTRQLPLFSAEGGLRFERLTGRGNLQTLEPRLAYLYVPFRDQDSLPVFDTGQPDFDIVQLFARNRFSGEDRVSDANQLAAALSTRLLDPASGVARLSATIGQLYRFTAPQVDLPGTTTPDTGLTDFIAAFDYRLSQNWSAGGSTQWSPDLNLFVRSGVGMHYRNQQTTYDLGYRFRRGLLEQVDTSLRLPLFDQWRFGGRLRYSIDGRRSLESLVGIEYENCCWGLQTSYRRYISNSSGEYSNGIYLQLELKGLARIGSDFDAYLPNLK